MHILSVCFFPRLRGSYERLWAGQVCEAVVDLSGGLAECWSLKKSVNTPGGRSYFPELSEEMRKQSYISCCVHNSPTGECENSANEINSYCDKLDRVVFKALDNLWLVKFPP